MTGWILFIVIILIFLALDLGVFNKTPHIISSKEVGIWTGNWEEFEVGEDYDVEQLNNSKIPIIVFDKKLEQFRGKTLFPLKLAKAGLPKTKK